MKAHPFGPPRPPFAGWPVQVVDARIGYVWFVAPNVFVSQAHVRHASVECAHAIHDWIDRVHAARRAEIDDAGGLACLHDWSALEGYDAAARRAYQERMRSRPRGYLKLAYTVVPASSPLLRMAVEAGNLAAQIGSGGRIMLATDAASALAKLRIHAPAASERFPGS